MYQNIRYSEQLTDEENAINVLKSAVKIGI
jgi:hypothetical protein